MRHTLIIALEVTKKGELSARHDLISRLDTIRHCLNSSVTSGLIERDYNSTATAAWFLRSEEEEDSHE